jgi:hypothetical protein
MTNTQVVGEIIAMTQDFLTFMLPVIGVLAGITFVMTLFFNVTLGFGRRIFRG